MDAVIEANVGPPCLCVEVGCDTVKEPTKNEQRYCFWQSRVVVRSPPRNFNMHRARVHGGAVNCVYYYVVVRHCPEKKAKGVEPVEEFEPRPQRTIPLTFWLEANGSLVRVRDVAKELFGAGC